MAAACLATTFSVKCPTGNVVATAVPDFASAGGLMCKACASPSTTIVDRDPRAGKFFLSISWGDLMTSAGATVAAGAVTMYQVVATDLQGRAVTTVGMQSANANPPSCCNPTAYNFKIKGNLSDVDITKHRLAIQPVSGSVKLPMIFISDAMTDASSGQVKTFKGDVKLTMSSADMDALAANPKAKEMLAKALAQTIGFSADEVTITAVWKRLVGSTGAWTEIMDNSRRLSMHENADATEQSPERRLGAHVGAYEMKIDYEVITADTSKTLVAANFAPAQLIANVQAESAAIGVPITITAASASAPVGEIVGVPTGTTGSSSGLFFHLLAAMLAVGTHLMF
jgi:hypothetical protein